MKRRNRKPYIPQDETLTGMTGADGAVQDGTELEDILQPEAMPAESDVMSDEEILSGQTQDKPEDGFMIEDPAADKIVSDEPASAQEFDADAGLQDHDEAEPVQAEPLEEEAPDVIEDGAETETADSDKPRRRLSRNGKIKEPMPKKKKIIIGVIAGVLAVAIILSIAIPVGLFVSDKVFVKSAEDLLAVDWTNIGKKHVYLQSDITVDSLNITAPVDIDLNKHTLTVSGTMTVSGEGEGSMTIGTVKGKGYSDKGSLRAGRIEVNTPAASFNLKSDVSAESISVIAAGFTSERSVNVNGALIVNAKTYDIKGSVAGNEAGSLVMRGGMGCVNANVSVKTSIEAGAYVTVKGEATDILASDDSYVVLDGCKASSVTGGKGVLALQHSSCAKFSGMAKLGLYTDSSAELQMVEDVDDIFYIEQLDTPSAVQVDVRGDKIMLTIAEVMHDENSDFYYSVTVGDVVVDSENENVDITSAIKSAGKYNISVVAKGNFIPDENGRYNIDAMDKDVYYLNSLPYSFVYEHTFTLDTPDNLSVRREQDGSVVLRFNAVNFADYYNVYINGADALRADKNELVITDKLVTGSNVIYVEACSNNEQIYTGSRALVSYVKTEALATPEVTAPVVNGGEVTVGWSQTEGDNTMIFEVVVEYTTDAGLQRKVLRTSANTVTVKLDGMVEGSAVTVGVKALGHGYYTDSAVGSKTYAGEAAA